jgi:hypothetical protein
MKSASLHGTLIDTVYCTQPVDFVDPMHPDMVCKLNRSLYSLKHASRAWYIRFATLLSSHGFVEAEADTSLFVFRRGLDTACLLYVDDIVITASSHDLPRHIILSLRQEFATKHLGELHHFLSIIVERRSLGSFLHHRQYTIDILERADI